MDTRVRLHTELPTFRLHDVRGQEVSLWDYKQRQPVVLVFCGEECETLLRGFAAGYSEYRDAGAEVLAITPKPPSAAARWPFPVLVDVGGQMSARYVERVPAVLLVDSYNTLHERMEGPWPTGLDHPRLLSAIRQLELQCPECGAPAWPEQ